MVSTNITKIYFRGNEIVALYRGDTLIFKKTEDVPTGKYIVRGTVNPFSGEQSIQLCVNGKQEQFNVNSDNTFEHTFVNVPVTNMDYFTQPCRDKLKTIDLSSLNTSKVTSMIQAFFECNKLEEIILTNLDTSNVTDMTMMFNGCPALTSLDVSNLDTSNVTNMTSMFSRCYNLKSLDVSNFDTSNVTNMTSMFLGTWNLTSLDLSSFNTSNVVDMHYMFDYDSELIDLYMNFDVRLNKDFTDIFFGCNKLTNVVGKFEGTKYDLNLASCPLTAQSAMVFINGLATVTEQRRLTLSRTSYDSLTPEQIAIATSKGWTVIRN